MLDASLRLSILSLLMSLKTKRNLSVLLITHDLASAKFMSDRTAVMYRGKLVEIGKTMSLLTSPHHPYTELILESTPRLTKEKLPHPVEPTVEEGKNYGRGCVFQPRCKYATPNCVEAEPKLEGKSDFHWAACYNPLNVEKRKP